MAQKFKGNVDVEGNLNLPNVTTGRALVIDGSGNVADSAVTETELGRLSGVTADIQDQLDDKIDSSEKGANNGVATLDSGGKIPVAQLPNSVMEYLGAWDADTNSPTLIDGTGNAGDVYRVSVAGTQDLGSGNITFDVGDFAIYSGSVWQKSPGADAVVSVNGQQGVVVLDSDDISEGATNLYFTDERAQDAVGAILVDSTNIDLTYDDGANEISASIIPDSIVNADISNGAAIGLAKLAALTANRAVVTSGSGVLTNSTITDTEIGQLAGVSSNIQDQLDAKQDQSNTLDDIVAATGGPGYLVQTNTGFTYRSIISNPGIQIDNGNAESNNTVVSLNIPALDTNTTADNGDFVLIYDNANTSHRKITKANLLAGIPISSAGDITETSFAIANNEATPVDVTDFLFANATVRSFDALVSVEIDATADLYETFKIQGIQKGSSWEIAVSSVGDNSDINFTITNAGQIQYTSANYAGFVSGTMKFRAITTSV